MTPEDKITNIREILKQENGKTGQKHADAAVEALNAGDVPEAVDQLFKGWFVRGHEGDHTYGASLLIIGDGRLCPTPASL